MKTIVAQFFSGSLLLGLIVTGLVSARAGTLTYTRDPAGRVVGVGSGSSIVTYSFDHAGSLLARNSFSTAGADLEIAQSITPDAPTIGVTFSVSLTVVNLASTAAVNVQLSDTLAASFVLVSVGVSQGSYVVNGSTLTAALGAIAPGEAATVILQLRPTAIGPVTHTVSIGSSTGDPFAANNNSTQILTVQPPPVLTLTLGAPGSSTGQLLWSAVAESFLVEETTSLSPPAVWTFTGASSLIGGTNLLPVSISGPIKFYRLRWP